MAKTNGKKTEETSQQPQQNPPEQTSQQQTPATESASQQAKKQVQTAEFAEAVETQTQHPTGKLDILLDMDVQVNVMLGQTQISVRRLLQLGPGSVLKLSKPVDTPVDLYLKDSKFAEADVVVVDNQFGLRIRQIIEAGSTATPQQQ
jgi:flagellar motor switch protein FliN/FliY